MPRIVCVVPTVRPDRYHQFKAAWADLFARHGVTLVTVWDGDAPRLDVDGDDMGPAANLVPAGTEDLFCNRTDSVRNYGFYHAADRLNPDYVLTLDDDVLPLPGTDPIADHVSVMGRRVPVSWMNTACDPAPYLRGVPYAVRTEAVVRVSHGVWTDVPDFDAPTQLRLTGEPGGVPTTLPYYRGPVPKGVYMPLCGMCVMCDRTALPHLYYAPMGPRGHGFNRFGDIWLGVSLARVAWAGGWAVYTGACTIRHSRASDTFVNLAQEAEGLRWNEVFWRQGDDTPHPYFREYAAKRRRYAELVAALLGVSP